MTVQKLLSKKILLSLLTITTLGVIVFGATRAFFSDSETSTNNKFVAGAIDLKVDNSCSYNGKSCVLNSDLTKYFWADTQEECFCSWEKKDLENELFFNFPDVKPGDYGEDTISLHVDTNDAWICAKLANLENMEKGCSEPESLEDSSCGDPGLGQGELQDKLLFTVWKDTDCNSILDTGEQLLVSDQKLAEGYWPIADKSTGEPVLGNSDYCVGLSWRLPSGTVNIAQTDSLRGDLGFYAVQSRNNGNFICTEMNNVISAPTPTPISAPTPSPSPDNVWINEFHYDNVGTDTGEFIEVAGPAGTDLTGWKIVLYNGSGEADYKTTSLSGILPNNQNGFGTNYINLPTDGLQNGSPDGIALVKPDNSVKQFLSYEGIFTASNGPAMGMTSTDIGVMETNSEPVGHSLQLVGTGNKYGDFTWSKIITNTAGSKNTGQIFN